ncbi:MAG: DUF4388 domain-containing protein [Blastochloris sp.]|nr:DUF4388 domain-containing protein [Blastochloris sp.]
MFSGSLKQMDLSAVLKLLSASHQTGALKLFDAQNGTAVATIFLQAGQLVHAEAAQYLGLDAVSICCHYDEEAFAFEENEVSAQQTLAAYPTNKLLEKISDQIQERIALKLALPHENEVPVYDVSASLSGLDATPSDLSLLILCNGSRTVSQVAQDSRRTLQETSTIIAKFRKAGIILIRQLQVPAPAPLTVPSPNRTEIQVMTSPESSIAVSQDSNEPKQARYWRGKLIEE